MSVAKNLDGYFFLSDYLFYVIWAKKKKQKVFNTINSNFNVITTCFSKVVSIAPICGVKWRYHQIEWVMFYNNLKST